MSVLCLRPTHRSAVFTVEGHIVRSKLDGKMCFHFLTLIVRALSGQI